MASSSKSDTTCKTRLVIQQCLSAKLILPDESVASIGKGMVVFVCFLKEAAEDNARKAAETVTKVRLSENDDDPGKRVSILDLPGEILVIPQATLGGKLKGKSVQYHTNVDKTLGEHLYDTFCGTLKTLSSDEATIKSGVYGARQVLSMETNGPYTHVIEL